MNQREELQGCRKCQDILSDTNELPFTEERYLVIHVVASLINNPPLNPPSKPGKKTKEEKDREKEEKKLKKDDRDKFCRNLKCLVSALRNTGGGVVLVHIEGLVRTDSCLHHFHELVDPRLNEMIENGSLFVNVYRKNWIKSIFQEDGEASPDDLYSDVVAVVAVPTNNVVTVEFNTKVPQDFSIVDPTCEEIVHYLKAEHTFQITVPRLRGLNNSQESRKIQHKAFVVEDEHLKRSLRGNPASFAKYIWNTLKLGQSISAFSKVEGGGSFYLGVAEEKEIFPSYITQRHHIKGFQYDRRHLDELKVSLRRQIKDHTLVLFFGSDATPAALPPEYVEIEIYELSPGLYVCEVAIAAVNGLVFHSKKGPEAYDLDSDNKLELVDIQEWKRRLLKVDSDSDEKTATSPV